MKRFVWIVCAAACAAEVPAGGLDDKDGWRYAPPVVLPIDSDLEDGTVLVNQQLSDDGIGYVFDMPGAFPGLVAEVRFDWEWNGLDYLQHLLPAGELLTPNRQYWSSLSALYRATETDEWSLVIEDVMGDTATGRSAQMRLLLDQPGQYMIVARGDVDGPRHDLRVQLRRSDSEYAAAFTVQLRGTGGTSLEGVRVAIDDVASVTRDRGPTSSSGDYIGAATVENVYPGIYTLKLGPEGLGRAHVVSEPDNADVPQYAVRVDHGGNAEVWLSEAETDCYGSGGVYDIQASRCVLPLGEVAAE